MNKFASHNSVTGEKSKNFWHKLLVPFSRCQSKTIKEQCILGCTYFDIRFRLKRFDQPITKGVCCHGMWESEMNVYKILSCINYYLAKQHPYILLTYEGEVGNKEDRELLKKNYKLLKEEFPDLKFEALVVKYGINAEGIKVSQDTLVNDRTVTLHQKFKALDGRSWHTYLPIPWLWDKIYYQPHNFFNSNHFCIVDFL